MISLTFIICHLSLSRVAAQQLRVEYFFDSDPGRGKAVSMDATTDADGNFSFDAPTTGLTPGNHLLGFRAFKADDVDKPWFYGPTLTQQVYVPHDESWTNISRVEYFWDEDPGRGKGTAIAITPGTTVDLDQVEISTAALTPGTHLLGIRAFGGWGWGPTLTQQVYVPASDSGITRVEYFWDSDPGFGKGTAIAITPGQEIDLDNVELSTEGLSVGEHHLFIRAYGYAGWTPTFESVVRIMPDEAHFVVNRAEYFWDEDPGFGKGKSIDITPGQQVNTAGLGLSVEGLSVGEHQLFVRYRSPLGWSPTVVADVVNISDADLKVSNAEYFWNDDPGFGQGTPIALMPGETVNLDDFQVPSASVHGDAVLFIRYRGPLGWSPTVAYPVMVDAEGNYTLNANAETSMEQRNYQSLTDALNDFTDRGIGSSITLTVPTTNTDYALDATSEQVLAQLAQAAGNLERVSTARDHETIAFTAAEGSGNTLTVTTTDEGLPTVVSFFAQTTLTNVALTINGTAYDFSSAIGRSEEVCAQSETTPVDLTAIGSAVTVTFTALPHEGTVLSGFAAEATGTLPAMTIAHSGTKLDSVAYVVTLANADGQTLYQYTYYIYVHPRMADQTLNGLTPATGSSLDPGEVVLTWNKVDDAIGGYRLNISAEPMDANAAALSGYPAEIDTDETAYTLTAVTGYTYTWTVTAIGYCDEKTSEPMTFSGRLLPDLVVSSISLPEAAECGNTITVTATVKNQGEGPTTEGSWTDRLYYVVDNEDFGDAVQLAEIKHTDNLAVGGSYDVVFQLKVPYLDGNQLRIFIETDVAKQVLESNNDNNRLLSATAELEPFEMNTNDLAALRNLYDELDGANWNGTPWNTASELITENNWSGVTFDTEGRVTTIDLKKRGLKGTLPVSTVATLSQLKTLNLSGNHIDGITEPLPETLTSVNLSNQDLETCVSLNDVVEHNADLTALLPNITTYNSTTRSFAFDGYFQLTNSREGGNQSWRMNIGDGLLQQVANPTVVYNEESGHIVRMRVHNGSIWNDMFLSVDYIDGDANLDGWRNVADLQHLINYAVNDTHTRVFFNFKAADLQPDGSANVLDVVRLVNLLLDDEVTSASSRRRKVQRQVANEEAEARLAWRGQELVLITPRPVAALDISLHISAGTEVQWMPDESNWQVSRRSTEETNRAIVYSLNGRMLPEGETVVARISSGSALTGNAMLVDADARKISVSTGTATGISEISPENNDVDVFSVDGVKHQGKVNRKGLYIVNGKKEMVK